MPTKQITFVCFPWAGGTSSLYAPWLKHPGLTSAFSSIVRIDYPGRASRSDQEPIGNVDALVDSILESNDCFDDIGGEIVLFGHSFGAVVAFEVARRLEERGQAAKAVFVSASVPPSKSPLVETEVSKLSVDDICKYFASKGNPVSDVVLQTPGFLDMFIQNVRVDYSCLETYPASSGKLKTPLVVVGGELDPGVSLQDLQKWKGHVEDGAFLLEPKVYPDRGHFYLNDKDTLADLGDYIVETVHSINDKVLEVKEVDAEKEAAVKGHVWMAFQKTLALGSEFSPDAHFFNELGGSSLDTMVLIAQLIGTVGLRVTQDEIILHPTVNTLAKRIVQLQEISTNAPTLDPVNPKEEEWFSASAQQEQMVALWETAPSMYNMPTTIEFKGNLQVDVLKKAMFHVVKQQQGLRTIVKYDMMANKVMQKVLSEDLAKDCLEFVEFGASDDEDARQIIERESGFIFNLAKPPVIRAVIVKTPSSYLLLLNQHHVGSDGWSRTQQRRQYLKAYLALKEGREPEVIPKHPSYLDWTMYTHRLLYDHEQKKKQLEYWKTMLEDLPVLDLPLDHVRPQVLSSRGARIAVRIPPEVTQQFTELMAKANSNLFVGLLSLYMSLLNVWGGGGNEKFSIGVAMANRQHEGLEHLVGYFANEVAIVADFQDDPSFMSFLGKIRTNVLDAMANSDVPFHEVCEAMKVERSSSRTSIFQAMFALQEREWHSVDDLSPREGEDDISFKLKQYNHNTSKFEVHLQLRHDGEGGLEGDFHIATDLFTVETGRRLVEAYVNLMKACIKEPDRAIARHDILPKMDREVIATCNATSKTFAESSLWELIEDVNSKETAFVVQGDNGTRANVSYDAFRHNSKSVAQYLLQSMQTGSDEEQHNSQKIVGILIRNSAEGVMMTIGTYLAGCTAVILDIDKTPVERINIIFQDAGVCSVLVLNVEEEIVKSLDDSFSIHTWDMIVQRRRSVSCSLNPPTNPSHPFAIFYTSGTTGLPKGVVIELGNIMNLRNWWVDYFPIKPKDRCMLFSSLSFIMSLRQWLPPLTMGASVAIPKSVYEFEECIESCSVNKLVCTPSALAALDIARITRLDAIQVAGEPPQKQTLQAWAKKADQVHIGLGPTELCAHACCGAFDGENICIGKPASNVRAYVVNKHGVQCPINCVGELWIAGANVARYYLNRAEENKKHFATDPFTGDGSRLYKTGDLCRRMVDGRIQFIGRRDKQIKLNGYRIEIGDIQGAMGTDIQNSHILVNSGKLVAFVTPKVDISNIKASLQEKLPTYMVPNHIVALDSFPLNKNRKVDAAALMEHLLLEKSSSSNQEDTCLETHIERVIKNVWSEVLGIPADTLKKNDNFFSSGGTSLTAVILSRKLAKELHTDVNVQDVFRFQTIVSFADHIEAQSQAIHGMANPLTWLDGGERTMNKLLFGVLQLFGIGLMTILVAVPLLATSFISIRSIIWFGAPGIFLFPLFVVAGCLVHMLLVFLAKWMIMGTFKPGKAKVFSWYFLKWWLTRRVIHVTALYAWVFDETPLSSIWLKLLGASIGKNTSLEQPYILEPDLVTIGNNCVIEFETQLSTSEIKGGVIEFRPVSIGDNCRLGVRSVLLGGTTVANGCEVLPKSALDFYTTTEKNQIIGGSPASVVGSHSKTAWRKKQSAVFVCLQLLAILGILLLMAFIAFVGVSIGLVFQQKYGAVGLVAYLGAIFSTLASVMFLLLVAVIYRILLPKLQPNKVYSSSWFLLRKWFVDRLFLSPMFRYASERTLQTSSTFPLYLRLLGAQVGAKAWMNHPYIRVGVQFLCFGSDIHMGMLNYLSVEQVDENGVSFCPTWIGDHVSFGQRCVALSGAWIGERSTIGAETFVHHYFSMGPLSTTFGSPPVQFHSSTSHNQRVMQLQKASRSLATSDLKGKTKVKDDLLTDSDDETSPTISRRQDIGREMFWTYIFVMLGLQALIPVSIGGSYALLYWAATKLFYEIEFWHIILVSPLIYIFGSLVLMLVLKLMQVAGGGFSVGTSNFFSLKFLYWHLLADMIYFCTSTVLYPLSGTQMYCAWLRFMGATIGSSCFISPENGGFREIDFMTIGDNCVLMTPNIHAHYTDHGQLQFCSVVLEDNVEINFGSTIMPLTQYQQGCRLRPHSVTVKGQICEKENEYFGNPCKADSSLIMECGALLFPGQGSQYPGMLEKVKDLPSVQHILQTANEVLGYDVLEKSGRDARECINTQYAQPLMFVAGLAHAELMKQKHPTIITKIRAVAGFSLGELTALCHAGAISLRDALKLVDARAKAMARRNGGNMCNVVGVSHQELILLCKKTGCKISNIICNHQEEDLVKHNIFVCAGMPNQVSSLVKAAEKISRDDGSKARSKVLRVSGAFHCRAMHPALHQIKNLLCQTHISLPNDKLIYSNVTGRPYKSAQEIRLRLLQHLVKPVLWHDIVHSMYDEEGIRIFVECGPQQVLSNATRAYFKRHLDEEEQNGAIITSDLM